MDATLADGEANPIIGEVVVSPDACQSPRAVMIAAGMHETSGDWFYDTGMSGKSEIGGGIVTVTPGKGGPGIFAPRLDSVENSIKRTKGGGLSAP